MVSNEYGFFICIVTQDGNVLNAVPISVDWGPACQSAVLEGIRSGRLPHTLSLADAATIEPVWNARLGHPFITGFRALIDGNGAGPVVEQFSVVYFHALAQQVASVFVKQGALAAGETFNYIVMAQPHDDAAISPPSPTFDVVADTTTLPFVSSALDAFVSDAAAKGPTRDGLMPAFLHDAVLDDCLQRFEAEQDTETGGILVGRLHLDASRSAVFTEVTGHVPARYTESSSASLTFTARTWADVQATIARRGAREVVLGWWHTHPSAMFRTEKSRGADSDGAARGVSTLFFSSCDAALMRTCFPAAYSVALVLGDSGNGESDHALFGWCKGCLVRRGYHLIETEHSADVCAAAAPPPEEGRTGPS